MEELKNMKSFDLEDFPQDILKDLDWILNRINNAKKLTDVGRKWRVVKKLCRKAQDIMRSLYIKYPNEIHETRGLFYYAQEIASNVKNHMLWEDYMNEVELRLKLMPDSIERNYQMELEETAMYAVEDIMREKQMATRFIMPIVKNMLGFCG